jgi:hypothetical protein
VTIGLHAFGLRYGEYAFAALQQQLKRRYGGDLQDTLGRAVDCEAVANKVASRCVLGLCVGRAGTVGPLCVMGLYLAAAEVDKRFTAVHFDLLALDEGKAGLAGGLLGGGEWQARIDFGAGPRTVPARFESVR